MVSQFSQKKQVFSTGDTAGFIRYDWIATGPSVLNRTDSQLNKQVYFAE